MKKEVAKFDSEINDQVLNDFIFSSKTSLSEEQKSLFFNLAKANNLNPFKRQIYAIKYGDNFNIVTGYQTYIERATASGLLDGWQAQHTPSGAKVTIWRKDWKQPFVWEALTAEFGKNIGLWKTAPKFMILKVAIAQGFRLAFPNELGGMPYTQDEIEGVVTEAPKEAPKETIKMITDAQIGLINKLAKDKMLHLPGIMKENCRSENLNEFTMSEASDLIGMLKLMPREGLE